MIESQEIRFLQTWLVPLTGLTLANAIEGKSKNTLTKTIAKVTQLAPSAFIVFEIAAAICVPRWSRNHPQRYRYFVMPTLYTAATALLPAATTFLANIAKNHNYTKTSAAIKGFENVYMLAAKVLNLWLCIFISNPSHILPIPMYLHAAYFFIIAINAYLLIKECHRNAAAFRNLS